MAWPGTLPKPLLANYGFSEDLPIIRTSMEQGPDRVTRISSTYVTQVNASVMLTATQLEIFRNYIAGSEVNLGATWFSMPIVTTKDSELHLVRLTSVSTTRVGPVFQVAMTLETEEHIA
jgi:hypothetical protein